MIHVMPIPMAKQCQPEFCLKLLAHVSTGWATTDGTDSVSIVQAPARGGTKVNGAEFSHAGSSPEAKWLQGRRKCACIGVTVESPTIPKCVSGLHHNYRRWCHGGALI
jgi:hypothetical protein